MKLSRLRLACVVALSMGEVAHGQVAEKAGGRGSDQVAEIFKKDVRPILAAKCFSCHADGGDSGNVAFDVLENKGQLLTDVNVWHRALKNVRAGMMPPVGEEKLTEAEKATLEKFIKNDVFKVDVANPDPGRVTLRRLNRLEYRNTIRDLLDVDFNVDDQFPADDSGHGFDNIADVLTVSPMLLEKYISAAGQIVAKAVPLTPRVPVERWVGGGRFKDEEGKTKDGEGRYTLPYYSPAKLSHEIEFKQSGKYRLELTVGLNGRHADGEPFDQNRVEAVFTLDGQEYFRRDYGWRGGGEFSYPLEIGTWQAGKHTVSFEVKPSKTHESRIGEAKISLVSVKVVGPLEEEHWVRTKNHEKFFGKGEIPADAAGRRALAQKILVEFATKAFRRPVDSGTVERLVKMAEAVYSHDGSTFEAGISQAMVAVLVSPRFLFLDERASETPVGVGGTERYSLIDEYSLASRLSYFFWSSMPDTELLRLAGAGELRKNMAAQVKRLLADRKASAFFSNFPGQWLQSRDVETVTLDKNEILGGRQAVKAANLDDRNFGEVRDAMRQETEKFFAYVVKENRSVLDFVDSNYTFLNERLADHYGVPGVKGREVRKVELPADSVRGGVITMGTTLLVTSNPTRTSPVKRGLFVLENILGTPPPPPPPDIPPLEEALKAAKGKKLTLREQLELHRSAADCMSCHVRLDPPGLAMESFNAVGMFRSEEKGQKIDSTGTLVSGETFKDVRELKKILVSNHQSDVYRCLTEKLLTYALGRGVEYYDVETVDRIVAALEKDGGKFETMLNGVLNSSAFQRRRPDLADSAESAGQAVSSVSGNNVSGNLAEKASP